MFVIFVCSNKWIKKIMDLWWPFELLKKHGLLRWKKLVSISRILTISFFQGILVPKAAKSCENFKHRCWRSSKCKKGRLVWTQWDQMSWPMGFAAWEGDPCAALSPSYLYSRQKAWIALCKLDCNQRNYVSVVVNPIWHDWSMPGLYCPRVSHRSHKHHECKLARLKKLQRFSPRKHALGPGMCDCCMSTVVLAQSTAI